MGQKKYRIIIAGGRGFMNYKLLENKLLHLLKNINYEDVEELAQQYAIDYSKNKGKSGKEYILCAAIHFRNGVEHVHQPKNIKSGFVITGSRHHNCYITLQNVAVALGLEGMAKKAMGKMERDCQGFITNFDRFVDRKKAMR